MRLQTVPDEYIMPAEINLSAKFQLICNGVPCLLAEQVAKSLLKIYYKVFDKKSGPKFDLLRMTVYGYITRTYIIAGGCLASGRGANPARFRQRRNHRNSRRFALLARAVATESRTRRASCPCEEIRFGTFFRTYAESTQRTQNHDFARCQSLRLCNRSLDITHRRRSHSQNMGRRILTFQRAENSQRPWPVVSQTRCQIDEVFPSGGRSLAQVRLAAHQKKQSDSEIDLVGWNQSQ